MQESGTMELKTRDGKLDMESLEASIKKRLPGHSEFNFDVEGNKVFVTARKKTTPKGKVELYVFYFFH